MQTQPHLSIDIGIVSDNEHEMTEFYERILGLQNVGAVTISGLGKIIKLQWYTCLVKLLIPERQALPRNTPQHYLDAAGLRYFTIHVRGLEDIVDKCILSGTTVITNIVSPRPGVRAAIIADPDGNAIELMETA